jgi:hypothetical protein
VSSLNVVLNNYYSFIKKHGAVIIHRQCKNKENAKKLCGKEIFKRLNINKYRHIFFPSFFVLKIKVGNKVFFEKKKI